MPSTHLETATSDAERHGFDALAIRAAVLRSAADAFADGRGARRRRRRHGARPAARHDVVDLAVPPAARRGVGPGVQPARALAVAEEALAFVAATGEAEYEAELHRVRGEQLHALGDRDAAVGALRTALAWPRRARHAARGSRRGRAACARPGWPATTRCATALPGLVLDVDEPDLVRLRDVVATMTAYALTGSQTTFSRSSPYMACAGGPRSGIPSACSTVFSVTSTVTGCSIHGRCSMSARRSSPSWSVVYMQ